METLVPLDLPPGLMRNGTRYQHKGRWVDGQLVRWHEGALQPVGGWLLAKTTTGTEVDVVGFPRGSHSWRKNDASVWLAVGTTGTPSKLYVFSQGVLTDITPTLTNGVADGSLITGSGGWGEGGWGDVPWGGTAGAGNYVDADTWSLDNFGEILIACLTSDGKVWESTPTAVATQVTNSPTGCRGICVTPERFIFALGASGDPRNVAWCSQAARTVWTPSGTNSAGSFPLQTTGRLMAGKRTARETLLWTDTDVWGAVYIGGALVYAFQQRGEHCGLISPNAVAIADGAGYWMGNGQFWRYDGAVRPIPCDVGDYVFEDLNQTQRAKICAIPIEQFGEVWWFYPSASQSGVENDRYVALNYREGFWMTGTLGRAAGVGAGVFANPQLWDANGKLYTHESGDDRGQAAAFIESGPLELGNGDRVLRLQSLIPDELLLGHVQATFLTAFQPTEVETTSATYTLASRTDVRETGRQVRLRLTEVLQPIAIADGSGVADGSLFAGLVSTSDFRIGTFRLGVIPGGRR